MMKWLLIGLYSAGMLALALGFFHQHSFMVALGFALIVLPIIWCVITFRKEDLCKANQEAIENFEIPAGWTRGEPLKIGGSTRRYVYVYKYDSPQSEIDDFQGIRHDVFVAWMTWWYAGK